MVGSSAPRLRAAAISAAVILAMNIPPSPAKALDFRLDRPASRAIVRSDMRPFTVRNLSGPRGELSSNTHDGPLVFSA
jgi:hypothetical protein